MSKVLIILSLILVVSCDSTSKEKITNNDVVISDLALIEITIPNTQISISIPVEFTELLIEDIELKWGGNKTAPKWATGGLNKVANPWEAAMNWDIMTPSSPMNGVPEWYGSAEEFRYSSKTTSIGNLFGVEGMGSIIGQ